MSTMTNTPLSAALLAMGLLTGSLGTAVAGAADLEEVVARGSRAMVVAERARFEAEMAVYATRVEAAIRDQVRDNLALRTMRGIRVARTHDHHRG